VGGETLRVGEVLGAEPFINLLNFLALNVGGWSFKKVSLVPYYFVCYSIKSTSFNRKLQWWSNGKFLKS
jgi:hypothetical protein